MKKLAIILAVVVSVVSVWASPNIGLKGIGPRIGFVDPNGPDGTFTLGVVADMGTFAENVPWEIAATWWSSGEEWRSPGGVEYDWSYTDIALRTTAAYLFDLGGDLKAYPGGGLALHFMSFDWEGYTGGGESETDISIMLLGGFQFPIAEKWHGQVELQFEFGDESAEQTNIQLDLIYHLK